MFLSVSEKDLEILDIALSVFKDMTDDVVFDAFPWNADSVRQLAKQSDEYINGELRTARAESYKRVEQLVHVTKLLEQVNNMKNTSTS